MSGLLISSIPAPAISIAQPVHSAPVVSATFVRSLSANPLFVKIPDAPNFDKEVLEPLKIQQEKERVAALEAAQAAAAAQAVIDAHKALQAAQQAPILSGGGWAALRNCESGGNYATNTGNGYYGAYQYDIGTWNNYGGYHLPSDAPASVQDAKAQETYNQRGASPWPVCGRLLSGST